MSGRTWVYSDPHFYHQNICHFVNFDGTKVRPWDDAVKMTNDMIDMYNEVVDDGDRVYILGDVAFSKAKFRESVGRLKGRKAFVPGNHDPVKATALYNELGLDVRGYVVKKGFIMSHIPIHPNCMGRWQVNIHGHLHNNTIKLPLDHGDHLDEEDTRYYNACVERHDFKPKLLDDILKEVGLRA
jgi:calcineurin-like phosphoesterase family protein